MISKEQLTGLACHLGVRTAIEFAEFEETTTGIDQPTRVVILKAWLAMQAMPNDAGLERSDILAAITKLRDYAKAVPTAHSPPGERETP